MNLNIKNSSDDLIHDPLFFEWVIRPTQELDQYWNQFILENPFRQDEIWEAKALVKSIIPKEEELSDDALLKLWDRIDRDVETTKKTSRRFSVWAVAASFILLLGMSGLVFLQLNSPDSEINYQSIAKIDSPDNDVKLIFADQSEQILKSADLDIKYNSNGEILVNSDEKISQQILEKENEEQVNQLVVPRGKRTSLTLSDGTKLWLNSGSRAIFPIKFSRKKREIFIEGEAYLEVAHDATKPFYVVTDKIHVKVLGTKFNVCSYPEDQSSSIVLVEGSVRATVDAKDVKMLPNQILRYEKNSLAMSLKEVDVSMYTSWKDGWMYCEKEKLETIATRLSRYYDMKIEFKDQKAREMTLTGKLDLKSECVEIFDAVCSTAPIKVEKQSDGIVISSK